MEQYIVPYYADNLISFFYPVKVRVEGKWPYLEVITNKRYSRFCIGLLEPNQTFSGYYLSMFDPTKLGEDFSQYVVPEFKAHVQAHAEPPDKYEVIRAGDYGRFPGAKELLFKENEYSGLNWSTRPAEVVQCAAENGPAFRAEWSSL